MRSAVPVVPVKTRTRPALYVLAGALACRLRLGWGLARFIHTPALLRCPFFFRKLIYD
jgi:hypothetical protein